MKNFKTLGDACKYFEKNFSLDNAIPYLPVIIRIDGNNFSKYTSKLKKPFDEGLTDLMIETTKFCVKETNAVIGYTQSDEITLILYTEDKNTQIYHDGKKQKILSKLTSKLTNFFNDNKNKYINNPHKAVFDCRVYQVPSLLWAVNQLIWRENDAVKNSISMVGQEYLGYGRILGLNGNEVQNLLLTEKNINWNDYHSKFKRGTYVKRTETSQSYTADELSKLPEKHQARMNPEITLKRNIIQTLELPRITSISNTVEFIFKNQDIILKQ